jgi:putative YhbY family RNA-binding protein
MIMPVLSDSPLASDLRRRLRARAHALQPVVAISAAGVTDGVLREIDASLKAHELIKVKVAEHERPERAAILLRICAELKAEPVQHIGKILVLYREQKDKRKPVSRRPAERGKRSTKRSHQGHSSR